jgi:hypothetical protein
MELPVIFLLAAVVILGALVFGLTCLPKKGKKYLDVQHYRAKCLEIEHQLKQDEPSSYHLAIMNADKLVDRALRDKGVRGNTMGERMRNASKIFSDNNGIWGAHKLRNKVAHDYDVNISYKEARFALVCYRKALKDLGAI